MNNEELVKEYQISGDEELLQKLITINDRLIYSIIKKYGNKNNDPEDSYQDAVEGFIIAINSFKFEKNTKLSTWAYQQVRNYLQNNDPNYDWRERKIHRYLNENQDKTHEEIWDIIKSKPNNDISKELFDLVATKREVPIDKKVQDKDGNSMFIVDMYHSSNQDHSELYFEDMFATLNPRQNKIATMLLDENTHEDIKKNLRLSDVDFNRDLKTIQTKVLKRM